MVIKVNPLDPESIEEARKKLDDYRKTLGKKAKEIVQRLTDIGYLKAIEYVPFTTGKAASSISGYVEDGRGIIRAGGYCAFIEFGTGSRGEAAQHPSPEYMAAMQWAYNVGITIFTTKDGRTGWYFPLEDGTWRFTEGMPSRPFMYETMQYLKQEYQQVAREVLSGKGQV